MKAIFCLFLILFVSCKENNRQLSSIKTTLNNEVENSTATKIKDSCDLEKLFVSKNLVNIHSLDTSIRVSLIYSTNQNFLNKPIYEQLQDCYLPCQVAIKLSNAQYYLKQQFPNYSIIVFDATRPLSSQKKMWEELDLPYDEKINYLAHPNDISLHNYGAAVDVGIISNDHLLLDMGTTFDSFEELSKPKNEMQFYKDGKLSKEALANRLLLRTIMVKSGFTPITSEWWHFNATTKVLAAQEFILIN